MKRGTTSLLALDPHRAAHQLREPLADRQAQARAAILPGRRAVHLAERLEQPVLLGRRNADAAVAHRHMQHQARTLGGGFRRLGQRDVHRDFAALRELHRVAGEVHHDLPQARHVANDGVGHVLLDEVAEVQAFRPGLGAEQFERLLDAGAQLEGMILQRHAAGFDLREVQDVIDDRQQRVAATADRLHAVALLVGQLRVEQQRGHAHHAVHRRADFMAHVREELGLRPRRFLQLLIQRNERRVAVHELLLAFAQRTHGVIALHLREIGARVVAHARDQLELVRQLHEVIVRAREEGVALARRLVLRREHDDGNVLRLRRGAVTLHQRQAARARHDQVLENHRRLDLDGDADRRGGIRAVVKVHRRFGREDAAHRFGDQRLVVHQQHHGPFGGRAACGIVGSERRFAHGKMELKCGVRDSIGCF